MIFENYLDFCWDPEDVSRILDKYVKFEEYEQTLLNYSVRLDDLGTNIESLLG